jgi:uncharacterized protein YjiS (DUF1127 family)
VTTLALSRRHPEQTAESGVMAALVHVARNVMRRRMIRNDRQLLQAMPDHLLADIGITRGDIARVTEYGRDAIDFG